MYEEDGVSESVLLLEVMFDVKMADLAYNIVFLKAFSVWALYQQ